MLRTARKNTKTFLTGTALPWASSAIVSAVNPRFFRFKRPLKLALWVAFITLIFTVAIGCAVYFRGCRRPQVSVPLSQIMNKSETFQKSCNEVYLPNFFISPTVDSSVGQFGLLSSLFPSLIDRGLYSWAALALYELANVTYESPIDRALSDFNTKFEHSVMASYNLSVPVPKIPGSKSEGQSLPWQFQFFNSTNLNGTKVAPEDCPVQWKAMLTSTPLALNLQGRKVFVRVNNTLDWTCTSYAWLFAEVSRDIKDPKVQEGNLTVGAGAPQKATWSVANTDNSRSALLFELAEAVQGSWFPPLMWCTEVFHEYGHLDSSWCASITYAGLQNEARRHIRKVSNYYQDMMKMNNEATWALQNWTDTLKEVEPAGYILDTPDDFRKVRNSIILFMSHMSNLLGMMTSSQFEREFESSLQLNTIVCRPKSCPPILGTIGSALGYTGLLEVVAAFIVLVVYLLRHDDETATLQQLNEVVFESVPEEVIQAAYKAYVTENGESSVQRREGAQKPETQQNGHGPY